MDIHERIIDIRGVGHKTDEILARMGIRAVSDLLVHYPRTYLTYPPLANYEELKPKQACAIYASLHSPAVVRKGRRMDVTLATAFFGCRSLQLIWFRMPYIRSTVKPGEPYVFYGTVEEKNGRLSMQQPQVFTIDAYQELMAQPQPVYSVTEGISNKTMTRIVRQVLGDHTVIGEYLPTDLIVDRGLAPLDWAIHQIHFPEDFDSLVRARRRLVYDEFFFFLMEMQLDRKQHAPESNTYNISKMDLYSRVISHLPYQLTEGQESALADIQSDLGGDVITQRLIQGDVGSGKTIIAFLAMLLACENGYQAAIMAPTEVLARQHAREFEKMCDTYGLPFEVVCLTGSMTVSQKREARAKIEKTPALFIVGTHALIQESVIYHNLAVVVTDEQHRFGVKQRRTLSDKGIHPFTLVMSATPIPRTLAMILYGDMNLSVIRDVPARRLKVKNAVIAPDKREVAWNFILREVHHGRQAYVICPLVEESEGIEAEDATDYSERLRSYYGGSVSIGLLHGRMKPQEKNRIMEQFLAGKIEVLVSTTVVEVGVNVPNATVMLIEDANHFGLAQLHQLRGRVGRGEAQSYCILIDSSEGEAMSRRLEILSRSNDGFEIAREDLALRGPGDFYGIRQSGDLNFRIADIYQDAGEMQQASEDVSAILTDDPDLSLPEHTGIKAFLHNRRDEVYTNL